jgi:sulfur transfer protein SufE
MARKNSHNTLSLWTVIESMQARLEGEGLDAAVVDAAVTRGLEAILTKHIDGKQPRAIPFLMPALAEA